MGSGLVFAAFLSVQQAGGELPSPSDADTPSDTEIIVTGERVERSARKTASSVVVIGEEEIESSTGERVDDILARIPNVQLGSGSEGPAIRGMDTTGPLSALPAFLGGNRPRTTIVVDGRPVTYNEFVFGAFPLWDVDRIEVFRTPQTTTQGQNSIAGAIFVNSNDPGFETEFRARGIAGDFHTRQVSALASAPLARDIAAIRVAGDLRYAKATSNIEDVMRGADPNHDVYGLLRAKLLLVPDTGTEVGLNYVHSHSQAPQIVGVSAPFERRRDNNPSYGIFRINFDSLTATVRRDFANGLTANMTVTAGDGRARRFAVESFGEARNDARDWAAEAVLNWPMSSALRLTGGVSRMHVGLKQQIDLSLLSGSIGRFRDRQDGIGLFADTEFALSSRTTVTAGLRYQRDRQVREGALTATSFVIPVDFVGTYDAWLPKITMAHDVTPALRIGALVQKSYNPGGVTIRVDTSQPDIFDSERLWDFELFARARFAGGRATVSANLFHYAMTNAQRSRSITLFAPSGRPVGFANLFNVPKARSYGAEAQLDWRVSDSLAARLSAGMLSTRILETDGESEALAGNQFDRAPHFTAAAALDWQATRSLRLSAQMRHRSAYFTDPENTPAAKVDPATIVDARAEYRLGRAKLFAQVRNLFDTFAMLDLSFVQNGVPQRGEADIPRIFAFGVESRF